MYLVGFLNKISYITYQKKRKRKGTLCSRWWTQCLKQLQANQIEIIAKYWKSKMEVQCIKPQTWDQSKKIRISKDYKWSIELTATSKVGLLRSHLTNHIKHASTKFETLGMPDQFCHLSRKDATFSCITHWIPKHQENFTPQRMRKLAMKQKMLHNFPTASTVDTCSTN